MTDGWTLSGCLYLLGMVQMAGLVVAQRAQGEKLGDGVASIIVALWPLMILGVCIWGCVEAVRGFLRGLG